MRRSSQPFRDEAEFEQGKLDLHLFVQHQTQDRTDLYFFDETGFSLEPYVPYGWAPPGQVLEIPSKKSRRINVLGFWSLEGDLFWKEHLGRVNTDVVIDVFDQFCFSLQREAVVILDNASLHTSHRFLSKIETWQDQGLDLYYLPPYSPELNWIEMLWRKIKYQWLPLSAYECFESLRENIRWILDGIGDRFQLNINTECYT